MRGPQPVWRCLFQQVQGGAAPCAAARGGLVQVFSFGPANRDRAYPMIDWPGCLGAGSGFPQGDYQAGFAETSY